MTTPLPPVPSTVPDQPPANVPIFDQGNPYITDVPAMLATELVNGSGGQRLALTIRIPNGTVTVILAKDNAETWRDQISSEIAKMNGLIIPGGGHG